MVFGSLSGTSSHRQAPGFFRNGIATPMDMVAGRNEERPECIRSGYFQVLHYDEDEKI